MTIRVGTSGWSYPGGKGTWNGIFYPAKTDRAKRFDELAFYAERFSSVEVNSTFYGQPRRAAALEWVKRTPTDFDFSVKLYQKFTHPATATDQTAITTEDVDLFRAGVEPLALAGRLGAVLAQFPARFKRTPEARDYIAWLLTTFADYPMAVELRHKSWSDEEADTRALLDAHGAALVIIDEPRFASSIASTLDGTAGPFTYIRLHGRNAGAWWTPDAGESRYNYMYSEDELRPFADVVRQARAAVRKAYLYLNNHFAAQAVANAAMLRNLLDEPLTAPLPTEMVTRYPALDGRVPVMPPTRLL